MSVVLEQNVKLTIPQQIIALVKELEVQKEEYERDNSRDYQTILELEDEIKNLSKGKQDQSDKIDQLTIKLINKENENINLKNEMEGYDTSDIIISAFIGLLVGLSAFLYFLSF